MLSFLLQWIRILFCLISKSESVRCLVLCNFLRPWTHQAPLSMGFLRQEYWGGSSFPSSRDLPNPGIEPRSLALQADFLPSEPPGKPRDLFFIIEGYIVLRYPTSDITRMFLQYENPLLLYTKPVVQGYYITCGTPHQYSCLENTMNRGAW